MSDIAARFARDTANHAMEILHDQGQYRHLRFRQPSPRSWAYWFDLITVPNVLIFRGDGDSYVFSRLEDMFAFFRDSAHLGQPNFGYWAEKLTTMDGQRGVMQYEQEKLQRHVLDLAGERSGELPGLIDAVTERIINEFIGDQSLDRKLVEDFAYWADPKDEHAIPSKRPDFQFVDVWEWDNRDWHWWFQWACHGIVWGIGQYDAAKSVAS